MLGASTSSIGSTATKGFELGEAMTGASSTVIDDRYEVRKAPQLSVSTKPQGLAFLSKDWFILSMKCYGYFRILSQENGMNILYLIATIKNLQNLVNCNTSLSKIATFHYRSDTIKND